MRLVRVDLKNQLNEGSRRFRRTDSPTGSAIIAPVEDIYCA
jgi:hypothetical protein